MTTTEPNVMAQVEAHIAQYLRTVLVDEDDVALIPVREGQTTEEYALPFVAVVATSAQEIATDPGVSWWEITVRVSVLTSLFVSVADSEDGSDLDPDAATNHAAISGIVAAELIDYAPGTVITDFPAAIFGWHPESSEEAQNEKMFMAVRQFKAFAAPVYPE